MCVLFNLILLFALDMPEKRFLQIQFLLYVWSRLTINWSLLQLMLKSWSTEWNCAQLCITLWNYLNFTTIQLLTWICLEYWLKISTVHNDKPFMLPQVLSISYWYSFSWWQNIKMAQWFDMCQFCFPNLHHPRCIHAPEINYKQNFAFNINSNIKYQQNLPRELLH